MPQWQSNATRHMALRRNRFAPKYLPAEAISAVFVLMAARPPIGRFGGPWNRRDGKQAGEIRRQQARRGRSQRESRRGCCREDVELERTVAAELAR
ncbi:MAG: hypothetical protein Q8P67_06825 [archaeon]|nr:hypothetical protein [archaeon]